jgi:hypothetical protein
MTARSWFRTLFARTPRTVRKGAARCRPTLEALESRWLPSTIVVNSVLDNVNDAVVTGPTVTLREAVSYANQNGGTTITFAPDVAGKTITLTQGPVVLVALGAAATTIDGGTAGVTISGNHASRVFEVRAGALASLNGLTITEGLGLDNGSSTPPGIGFGGGGILNRGILVVTNCTLADNSGVNGGGILNVGSPNNSADSIGDGWLSLANCTLSGNSANNTSNTGIGTGVGGGIYNSGGTVTLTACTLSENSGNTSGNIANLNLSSAILPTSLEGRLTLTDCVVAQGVVTVAGGSPDLGNSGTVSGSNNLIGDGAFGGPGESLTDSIGGEPLLAPLGFYGGPTPTVPLLPGSLGIGRGIAASYLNPLLDTLGVGRTISITTDQRGFTLPENGRDIGAFQTRSAAVDSVVTATADNHVIGQWSLRDAVNLASATGGSRTITFTPGVAGQTITLTDGQLKLTGGTITLDGGTAGVTVSGANVSRVFQVDSGAVATFNALTITAGQADSGGGILNQGTLSLTACTLAGNSALSGGGIFNSGTLSLTACTLAGDLASRGGGIFNSGPLSLTACTLAGNSAQHGGGIYNDSGALLLTYSIVAQAPQGGDIYINGGSVSGSYDLVGDGSALSALTHSLSGSPLLGPLGDYGGPTQTLPLLPGSLGIAVGVAADYLGTTTPLTTDQRGQPLDSAAPDIGAFQTHFSVSVAGGSGQEAFPGAAFASPLRVTVSANNNLDPVIGGVVTFAGPTSGSSLASPVTAIIGNSGQAGANVTANGTVGRYTVSATVPGTSTSAPFSLTNVAVTFGSEALSYNGSPQSISDTVTPDGATYSVQYLGAPSNDKPPTNAGGYTLVIRLPDGEQASQPFSIARTNPTLTAAAGPAVVVGAGAPLTASATLAGGVNAGGTLTFTLADPNNSTVYTNVVPVSGNASYQSSAAGTSTGSAVPTRAGVYTWAVAYSGDGNNDGATAPSVSAIAVGSGATLVGTTLYLVGGNTSDTVTIKHAGSSTTGSTGIQVSGTLNGVNLGTVAYGPAPTLLDIITLDGNDRITLESALTVPATVSAGNGTNTIQLGQGNNSVTVGSGSDTITAGNGVNTIVANTGAGKALITLGNGGNSVTVSDTSAGQASVSVGDGNNVISVGNGNGDLVQAGKGNNTIAVGNGSKISVQATDGNNVITAGNGGGTIKVGNGNNVIVAGGGDNTITAGNGSNLIVGGLGKDSLTAGSGNNLFIDGSVNLSTGQLAAILFNQWIPSGTTSATQAQIRSQLTAPGVLTYNTTNANTLSAGGGFNWFWYADAQDHVNKKPNLLN